MTVVHKYVCNIVITNIIKTLSRNVDNFNQINKKERNNLKVGNRSSDIPIFYSI